MPKSNFKTIDLISLISETASGLSKWKSSNKKSAALKAFQIKIETISLKYESLSSEDTIHALKNLIKIAMTHRSSSNKPTSSGEKLLNLINNTYSDFRTLIVNTVYGNIVNRKLVYDDLLTFSDNFNPLLSSLKKNEQYNEWKKKYNIFSIDAQQKVPQYFHHLKSKSQRHVRRFKAYELYKNDPVFEQISTYMAKNINGFPYTSKTREATRMVKAEYSAKNSELTQLQRFNSWHRKCEGDKDGPEAPSSGEIEIVKIEAIYNPTLLRSYINNKSQIEASIKNHDKEALKRIVWHCETDDLPVIDNGIGEAFLFHQLNPGVAKIICNDNFDPTRGYGVKRTFKFGGEITTKGMLGEATYFSDSFSKCMTYSMCPKCFAYCCNCTGPESLRVTLLCRVLLGVPKNRPSYFCPTDRTKMRSMKVDSLRALNRHSTYSKGSKAVGFGSDLLLAGSEINEFAIQDNNQIYPEFIIYWNHKNRESDSVEDKSSIKIGLRPTMQHKRPHIYLPQFKKWTEYWGSDDKQQHTDEKTNALWQLLNDNIINKPYVDDNLLKHKAHTFSGSKPVYRFNHGILHSLRQLMYARVLISIITQYGTDIAKKTMLTIDQEQIALLELSCVLCRSGRTNEKGHRGDPTYSFRSGQIIQLVAERLLFNKKYIAYDGGNTMLEPSFPNMVALQKSTLTNLTPTTTLLKNIIDLSHHIDLIRTHSGGDVYRYTLSIFKTWFPDDVYQEMTLLFIDYATQLCLTTGDRISYKIFTPDSKKLNYDSTLFKELSNNIPKCVALMSLIHFGTVKSKMSLFPVNPEIQYTSEIESRSKQCVTCSSTVKKQIFCEVCGKGFFCSQCCSKKQVMTSDGYPADKHICNHCHKTSFKDVSQLGQFIEEHCSGDYDLFEVNPELLHD